MRILICSSLFLISFYCSRAQVNPNLDFQKPLTDVEIGQNYLKQGKTQTKNGFFILGLGLTMGAIGAVLVNNESFGDGFETGAGLVLAGTACSLISIPLFISGGRNKHKAKVIFSRNKIPLSRGTGIDKTIFSVGVGTLINR